jgi:hypothetical protein
MPSMLLPRRGAHDGYYVVCPRHGPVTVSSGKLQLCPYCAHARPVPKRRRTETVEQARFDEARADDPARATPAFRTRAP